MYSTHMPTFDDEIPPKFVDKSVQVSQEIARDTDTLSSDFSNLTEDGILPDFELRCGDRSFQVHRSVLSARSEVFRNMMQETKTGYADIKDLEVPVLQLLLSFIYSGKLEKVTEDIASSLYEASHKYAVHCLETACSYWIRRKLTEENCIRFLDISYYFHSDLELRAAVESFIFKHPRVLKSTAWLTFSEQHQELAKEILQTYVSSIIQ